MTATNQDKNHVKSIEKALDILLLFNTDTRELSHAEIARRMGWSTSTASRLLGTLLERDFLSKNEENGKYRLGNMIYYLGSVARRNSDIHECGVPVLEKLSQLTDETVHIFIRDGINRVCIEQIESTKRVRISSDIGKRDFLWVGSTGRVLLAFCPEEKREQLYQEIHEAAPEVDIELLRKKVQRVKDEGFARKDGDWDRHCACIAAPFFDQRGICRGSLGVSVPDFRFPEDDSDYVRLVTEGAKEISIYMGWCGQ